MEGGLQHATTTLLAGQHHAQRVRQEVSTGTTGRLGPNINPRTLLKTGGNLGLRSLYPATKIGKQAIDKAAERISDDIAAGIVQLYAFLRTIPGALLRHAIARDRPATC